MIVKVNLTPSSTSHDVHAINNDNEVMASKNNPQKPNDIEPGARESYSIMMNLPD